MKDNVAGDRAKSDGCRNTTLSDLVLRLVCGGPSIDLPAPSFETGSGDSPEVLKLLLHLVPPVTV